MTAETCPLPANAHGRYPQPAPLPAALPWRGPVALALCLAAAPRPEPAPPRLTLHTCPRPGRTGAPDAIRD